MKRDSLWTQARDVLFVYCDPMWVEFLNVPAARNRPVPFVDAFPVSLWIYVKPKPKPASDQNVSSVKPCEDQDVRPHRDLLRNFYCQEQGKEAHDSDGHKQVPFQRDGEEMQGKRSRQEAAIHILAHTPSLVSAQLNHYQYLFLMRQLDVVTELTTYLTSDTIHILTHPDMAGVALSADNLGDTLAVSAMVPQLDVSLVMPPPHPNKDSVAGDMESFLPDSSSTADLHDLGSPSCEVRNSASEHSIVQRASEADACSISSDITKSYSVDQLASPQPSPATTSVTKQPPATANGSISQPPVSQHSPAATGKQSSPSSSTLRQGATRTLSSSLTNLPRSVTASHTMDSDPSSINGPVMQLSLHDNLNAGFSTMRKGITSGFTNLMSTIESAVKTSPEDMSDTLSVRSDLSSDSDNFIMVNMESERTDSGLGGMDAAFRVENKPPPSSIELASEVFEEATPSEVSDVTSSFRRKDTVSKIYAIKHNTVRHLSKLNLIHSFLFFTHLVLAFCISLMSIFI